MRHIRLDLTRQFARKIDEDTHSLPSRSIGVDMNTWSNFSRKRLRLPIRFRGCGLREAVDRRSGKYLGAAVQSILPLVTRTENFNCTIWGRINISPLITLFEEDSFKHHLGKP